jgi:hypothetical protein
MQCPCGDVMRDWERVESKEVVERGMQCRGCGRRETTWTAPAQPGLFENPEVIEDDLPW